MKLTQKPGRNRTQHAAAVARRGSNAATTHHDRRPDRQDRPSQRRAWKADQS